MCLGRNDWEVLTSSPFYVLEGNYFSDNEWVSSDGAYSSSGLSLFLSLIYSFQRVLDDSLELSLNSHDAISYLNSYLYGHDLLQSAFS
jgi:hypothetical protein